MSNIKDFKSIADEMMSGVAVSERLKAQMLSKCAKKRRPMRVVLAPVAAAAAVVLVCVLAVSLPQQPGGEGAPNVMMATETASPLMTGQERAVTPEEAEEFLGGAFMMPEYVPQGFALRGISLTGDGRYKQVALNYSDGESSYVVIEETPQTLGALIGFESADINGIKGYMKSSGSVSLPETEAHWVVKEVHYAVIGSITEEEALKIARSMK